MGGVVNVAIRFRDGRTICQERWTNNTPNWFKVPQMFVGDETHLQAYLDMVSENDWLADTHAPGRPQPVRNNEYGLIVFDYLTNTILDNNTYTNLDSFESVMAASPGRSEAFIACARDGRLRLRTRKYDRNQTTPNGRWLMTSDLLSPPLTEEHARAFAKDIESRRYRDITDDAIYTHQDFIIDTSPMIYHNFPDCGNIGSWPPYRMMLESIGFPMRKSQGLNQTLRSPPSPREISENERIARNLFRYWKDSEQGKSFRGTRFEELGSYLASQFLDRANDIIADPERYHKFETAKLCGKIMSLEFTSPIEGI